MPHQKPDERDVPGHLLRGSHNVAYAATQPHLIGFGAILLTFLAEAKAPVDACMVEVGGKSIMSTLAM